MAQELNHIDAAISDLEAWRDRIQSSIDTLRHLRSQGAELPSTPPPGMRSASDEIAHDAFFQMSIPDAAKKYLSIIKRTDSINGIGEALLKGGLKTSSKNFAENVRTIIGRDDRFVKVNSEWGLSDWYPAMKRDQKQRRSDKRGVKKTKKPTESIPTKIKRVLSGNPGKLFTAEEIASEIQANVDSVRARLPVMARSGEIAKSGRGEYTARAA